MQRWIRSGVIAVTGMVGLLGLFITASAHAGPDHDHDKDKKGLWPQGGRNLRNTRHQRAEDTLGVENVDRLQVHGAADTDGDVAATPTVDASSVYVLDWAGKLYAFNRHTGALRWARTIGSITGVQDNCRPGLSPGTDVARATPTISGDLLILGDQGGRCSAARVFAVHKRTGKAK